MVGSNATCCGDRLVTIHIYPRRLDRRDGRVRKLRHWIVATFMNLSAPLQSFADMVLAGSGRALHRLLLQSDFIRVLRGDETPSLEARTEESGPIDSSKPDCLGF